MVIIFSMIITSLPTIRRLIFELFFYLHIVFAIAMIVCAFYHSGLFVVILATSLWGGDFFIRRVIMTCRYPRKATISRLTDTVIQVSIPKTKNLDYNSGQYMYIAVPELSIFQWHPISISSSPYQQNVTFHIRKRGYWTTALYNLAAKKKEITVLLEGPYGSLGVDLTSNRYKMAMFLSGGIGVTPMQSICHQMLYEHEWDERDLKKLWFIWTARDPEVMENMEVVSNHTNSFKIENSPIEMSNPIGDGDRGSVSIFDTRSITTEKILTEMPVSLTPDDELERELPLDDFIEDEDEVEDPRDTKDHHKLIIDQENQFQASVMNKASDYHKKDSEFHVDDTETRDTDSAEVLSLACYLTAKEMKEAGISSMPFVEQGRPDMKKIFLAMREDAIQAGEKRVAVCVCAPKQLVKICKMACIKYSTKQVQFDFHLEVFD
jgi:hypothetical protein